MAAFFFWGMDDATFCEMGVASEAAVPAVAGRGATFDTAGCSSVPGAGCEWQASIRWPAVQLCRRIQHTTGDLCGREPGRGQCESHGAGFLRPSKHLPGPRGLQVCAAGRYRRAAVDDRQHQRHPLAGQCLERLGRTGAVVAVSGDYSCAQITGAVCSLPTIYYQTIQQSGSTLPAEPKLNLIPGGDISLTCADNSSNGSTDCTVGYTAPTSTADIWFTFSTCTIAQTGNTYNCPSTYSGSPFPITTGGSFHIGGCTAVTPGPVAGLFTITQNSVTSTGFSYNWTQVMGNGTSGTAAGAQVTCIIHFDS